MHTKTNRIPILMRKVAILIGNLRLVFLRKLLIRLGMVEAKGMESGRIMFCVGRRKIIWGIKSIMERGFVGIWREVKYAGLSLGIKYRSTSQAAHQ